MKVTTQGEQVIDLLWDVIAAKGFEKDTFFEMAARDIRALPKLEGTVHVNIALILKFMFSYFVNPKEFPYVDKQDEPGDDTYLFNQGAAKGLGGVQFHDYSEVYAQFDLPNVNIFIEQIEQFKLFLTNAMPSGEQQKDIDFLMSLGQLFTQVVYGQLILENAKIYELDDSVLDQIFDFMVRDFSQYALDLHNRQSSTEDQMKYCVQMIRKPMVDQKRYMNVWEKFVYPLKDEYMMND